MTRRREVSKEKRVPSRKKEKTKGHREGKRGQVAFSDAFQKEEKDSLTSKTHMTKEKEH